MRCSMSGCTNDSRINKNVYYFKFPSRLEAQNTWKSICQIETVGIDARICSLHFKTCDIVQKAGQICLVKTALPLCYQSNIVEQCPANIFKIPTLNSINIVQNLESSIYNNNISWNEKHKENYTSLMSKTDSIVIAGNPEFKIHRKQTEIFSPDKFQCRFVIELPEPNGMPSIKSVPDAMSTQTNTRLCGSVEISEYSDEFRLNCFYCCKTFLLEKWQQFVEHLKELHLTKDPSYKIPNFPNCDHDYTSAQSTGNSTSKRILREVRTTGSTSLRLNRFKRKSTSDTESEDETGKSAAQATLLKGKGKVKPNKSRPAPSNFVFAKPHAARPPIKKVIITNKDEYIAKKVVQQTLLNIRKFEAIYKNVKTKPPKDIYSAKQPRVISSGICYIKNIGNSTVTEKQTKKTPLNRCLKRANTETSETLPETNQIEHQHQSELVFQFTPRAIIMDLLDQMKDFPTLWEFHREPNNPDYAEAIKKLCTRINEKWSLNLSTLQMRCSINRVLNFYRFMLPCKKIKMFKEYFDKCVQFLPTSVRDIPLKRCAHCDVCYINEAHIKKHLTDVHDYLKWPYKCDYCLERFRESDEYELHKNLPHYIEIYRCPKCNVTFNRRQSLKIHLQNHHQPGVPEGESASNILPSPVTNAKPQYKCHLCDKKYNQRFTLVVHLKKHRQEFDFVCEICGKAFLKRSHLNEHMEKHTGRKVTCNICNIQLRKSCLSRHLRLVHVACEGTLESTFRAKNYHYKRFSEHYIRPRRPIIRSKETKPRTYDCKRCNIHFERLKLLKDHNNIEHCNRKIMYCRICNVTFRHRSSIRQHYRNIHKLHSIQITKLIDQNEDIDKVLSLKIVEEMPEPPIVKEEPLHLCEANEQQFNDVTNHSPSIQDEIMKAIENIEKEEIKTDDNSMNDFFSDLMKH